MLRVEFVNLGRQYDALRDEILDAFDRLSRQGAYVFGSELEAFENEFASYCGTRRAVGLGNGSDAIHLPLLALGVGLGDEVITAPNSFVASAWAIARTGAKLVFSDVGDDMNLDPEKAEQAITDKTKAILVVHLTGRIARMEVFESLKERHGVVILEDAAQAVGARRNGRKAGSIGLFAGFSLHPLKNLHVHGDGGICVTNDEKLADSLTRYRNHGLENRNECLFWGVNSRLDNIQAAIGRIKLRRLEDWNSRYREIARYYNSELSGVVETPTLEDNEEPVYHRYMLQCDQRDELMKHLDDRGVGSAINYPVPLHLQPAAQSLGYKRGSFPVAERLADRILSIPLYSELEDNEVEHVVASVKSYFQ